MNKLKKLAAVGAVLIVLPLAAFAHDSDDNNVVHAFAKAQIAASANQEARQDEANRFGFFWPWHSDKRSFGGTVTAVGSGSFDLKTHDGSSYAVNVSNATMLNAYGSNITLADIHVNDRVIVKGDVNGSQISAARVIVTPANTHPARASGEVVAVNGNTLTIQSSHLGVAFPVTVNTNASTTVMQNGSATTTAAIQVGSKISIKGLWNEILNVLNAIKIRIK